MLWQSRHMTAGCVGSEMLLCDSCNSREQLRQVWTANAQHVTDISRDIDADAWSTTVRILLVIIQHQLQIRAFHEVPFKHANSSFIPYLKCNQSYSIVIFKYFFLKTFKIRKQLTGVKVVICFIALREMRLYWIYSNFSWDIRGTWKAEISLET